MKISRRRRIGSATAITVLGAALLAGSAHAATVTYTSTDVPKAVDDDFNGVSTLTVPSGRPAAIDVDVVGVSAFTPIGSGDRQLIVSGPNGVQSRLIGPLCNTFSATNVSFDDQAAAGEFGCNGAAGGTFKPQQPFSALTTPAAGTWTMSFLDPGNMLQAGEGQLNAWGVRVTHAPLTLSATAVKQKPVNRQLVLTATCNGTCSIAATGDASTAGAQLSQDVAGQVNVTLSDQAFKQFKKRKKGSASLTLTATNDIGDSATQVLTVPLQKPKKKKKKRKKKRTKK